MASEVLGLTKTFRYAEVLELTHIFKLHCLQQLYPWNIINKQNFLFLAKHENNFDLDHLVSFGHTQKQPLHYLLPKNSPLKPMLDQGIRGVNVNILNANTWV
jgi:hypothetical protein